MTTRRDPTDAQSRNQFARGPDLPVAERTDLLTDRVGIEQSRTTADRERVPIEAVATRIDGLTAQRPYIGCPYCDDPASIRHGEYGYALVNVTADLLYEWHLGDRCPEHATYLPDETDAIVLYRVEPGRQQRFYCRRVTVRASGVAGGAVK